MAIAVLIIYLVGMLLVAWFSRQSSGKSDAESYFLANRAVGSVFLIFTFIATNFSAFFFLGFAGEGYRIGYSYYAIMAFGTSLAAVSVYVLGIKIWEKGKVNQYLTAPEFVEGESGSSFAKWIFLIIMVTFTLPYMAIQPIGAGYIIETLTDSTISYYTGACILTFFMVLYVFTGGMKSVVITDVIQGILMFVLMFLAVFCIADDLGGMSLANINAYDIDYTLFEPSGRNNALNWQKWISLLMLWFFCVPMFPQLFSRFFIAKDEKAFKLTSFLYALVPGILFICPVMIGVFGHISFPGLIGKEADQILPMMLEKHAPVWLAATIMVGALAAFMSTMDSQLLALSTMITRDVIKPLLNIKDDLKKQVLYGRIIIVVLSLIALGLAYAPPKAIFSIVKLAFTGYSILFIPTVIILFLKQKTNLALNTSLISGVVVFLISYCTPVPANWFFGFEPFIGILFFQALTCAIIIKVGKKTT